MKKIAIVGDFWGVEEEAILRIPFQGAAGHCLNQMLEEAGIVKAECFCTTVFETKAKDAQELFCLPKKEDTLGLPPLTSGKYLHPRYAPELERLKKDLDNISPNIIVALGSVAMWAFMGVGAITKSRGTLMPAAYLRPGSKVLPTFHPGYVLKDWGSRAIVIMDLMKALRNSDYPEIRRPHRKIYIEPTIADLPEIFRACKEAELISVDIETAQERITCIGFAPSSTAAFVIPFWDNRRGGNYWQSHTDENTAWGVVREILALDNPKLFQNGLYDVHWLWRRYGMKVKNFRHDTMLLHHALQPEFPKGLGFLGSVYTDEPAWKLMKPRGDKKSQKKEDV